MAYELHQAKGSLEGIKVGWGSIQISSTEAGSVETKAAATGHAFRQKQEELAKDVLRRNDWIDEDSWDKLGDLNRVQKKSNKHWEVNENIRPFTEH